MPSPPRRKPRDKPAPYARRQPKKIVKDAPRTSAKAPQSTKRENLTLHDWLTVFAYIDQHPDLSQSQIVDHFNSKKEGALIFTQSTLSRKVKQRESLEARAHDNPNALSSKRPRVVTRPDVERALFLWVKKMEAKGETVNGPMLVEKRARFEEELEVPENERLPGDGWIASFCKTYKIKERRRHGEAGSVDLEAVEKERERLQGVLAAYALRDRWNKDETSFFPFAPPDRGLATRQMSGKKKAKFRVTISFACNADGSEKMPAMFIGKAKKPRCFKKQGPAERGFYYRNNKKRTDPGAWDILREFALSDMTLPAAEDRLRNHLGDKYNDCDWRPALKAVMDAEGNREMAQASIRSLEEGAQHPKLTIKLPPQRIASTTQLKAAEEGLMDFVNELIKKNRVFGEPLSLEELLDPAAEREDADSENVGDGGDLEAMIASRMQQEMKEASENSNAMEIDDSEEEECDPDGDISRAETIALCEKLERLCLKHGDANLPLELPRQLRHFRAQLRQKELLENKQSTLDRYFTT